MQKVRLLNASMIYKCLGEDVEGGCGDLPQGFQAYVEFACVDRIAGLLTSSITVLLNIVAYISPHVGRQIN
jgi:hypothetical protein